MWEEGIEERPSGRMLVYKHQPSQADALVQKIAEDLKGRGGCTLKGTLLDRCKWGGLRPQDIDRLKKRLMEPILELEKLHWNEEDERYD